MFRKYFKQSKWPNSAAFAHALVIFIIFTLDKTFEYMKMTILDAKAAVPESQGALAVSVSTSKSKWPTWQHLHTQIRNIDHTSPTRYSSMKMTIFSRPRGSIRIPTL